MSPLRGGRGTAAAGLGSGTGQAAPVPLPAPEEQPRPRSAALFLSSPCSLSQVRAPAPSGSSASCSRLPDKAEKGFELRTAASRLSPLSLAGRARQACLSPAGRHPACPVTGRCRHPYWLAATLPRPSRARRKGLNRRLSYRAVPGSTGPRRGSRTDRVRGTPGNTPPRAVGAPALCWWREPLGRRAPGAALGGARGRRWLRVPLGLVRCAGTGFSRKR